MSTDDRHAQSLGRWLEEPAGTTPPEDVDHDAVEAVYAIRPDLAPRARVSADDILALVTKGPLAGSGAAATPSGAERTGEVVQFPVRRPPLAGAEAEEATPAPAPARRGRFLVFAAGGTGGIGLALVAAATLLLVAVPALQDQAGPAASAPPTVANEVASAGERFSSSPVPASSPVPSPIPPSRVADAAPSPDRADSTGMTAAKTRAAAQSPVQVASTPATSAPPPMRELAAAEESKEMASARITADQRGVIPELAEPQVVQTLTPLDLEDSVASADESLELGRKDSEPNAAPAASAKAAADAYDQPAADPAAVRVRAVPTDRDPSSWRVGVDSDTLAVVDQAIEKANTLRQRNDRRGAGDALAAAVQPPPRVGQYVAALAAADYLAAGNAKAAASVAQRGLSLSTANTPERSWLLVVYGDALQQQDKPADALDAYELASELNVDR